MLFKNWFWNVWDTAYLLFKYLNSCQHFKSLAENDEWAAAEFVTMKCRKQYFIILFDFAFISFELPTSCCLLFVETLYLNNSSKEIMFYYSLMCILTNLIFQRVSSKFQVLLKPFFFLFKLAKQNSILALI
jgi:hypothetical protein